MEPIPRWAPMLALPAATGPTLADLALLVVVVLALLALMRDDPP